MDKPKFNNTNDVRVTDEEAQAKIDELIAADNRQIWTLRHEYKSFLDNLCIGATFKAKLASRLANSSASSQCPVYVARPAIFRITGRWPHVMQTTVLDGCYKLTCFVNVKDLWIEGSNLIVTPSRWGEIA